MASFDTGRALNMRERTVRASCEGREERGETGRRRVPRVRGTDFFFLAGIASSRRKNSGRAGVPRHVLRAA